ncbi:hypothetical protein HHI36_012666 [Cryptolaemus montrouzieri]|uniref:HTH psq-type domain-containing protein n=1 Tax=Cryptolaemus montrouzieri TaxID=559131 RepID=A0ABD2NFJ7_9CUCU
MTERKYFKWKAEDLQNALHDYENEDIGLNECVRLHNIPKATMKRHFDKGDSEEQVQIIKGRSPVFDSKFENILVHNILLFWFVHTFQILGGLLRFRFRLIFMPNTMDITVCAHIKRTE